MKKLNAYNTRKAFGASMVETIIVFPILMFVGLSIVHLGLVHQAKSNLQYAALMAAKLAAAKGYSTQDNIDEILAEIRYRMAASDELDGIAPNDTAALAASAKETSADGTPRATFRILSPNRSMFQAWGQGGGCGSGQGCAIPNAGLIYQNPNDTRNVDGQPRNLQEANILTLQVSYLIDTGVPFMRLWTVGTNTQPAPQRDLPGHESNPWGDKFEGSPGIVISATASVIMQTDGIANATNCSYIDGFTC